MESFDKEYKLEIPAKSNRFKAEIVSFLNSNGGVIYLGVDDFGNIDERLINLKKYDWEKTLSNWIVNAFNPDVTNLIYIYPEEIPFRIKILKGIDKPYFYKDGEGFNSKGVYLRVGSTKRLASFDEIQRMIRQNSKNDFETILINRDDLTFSYAENKFRKEGLNFDKRALSLMDKDGRYNNVALLISDQNPTITKFAVFQGLNVDVFLDKKEFRGSILEQLDSVLYYSEILNRKKVIITGKLARDEYLDYPKRALREAIVNCYCHRDWTLSGDIKLEFYDNRVQIFSPGGLPDGLTLENIKNGVVAKRNRIIVDVLDKVNMIENYASGVRRIFDDYIDFDIKPYYYISENAIIVTLYNKNYILKNEPNEIKNEPNEIKNEPNEIKNEPNEIKNEPNEIKNEPNKIKSEPNEIKNEPNKIKSEPNKFQDVPNNLKYNERRKLIVDLISKNDKLSINLLKNILGVSRETIKRDILKLKEKNIIEFVGNNKNGYWKINKKDN